MKKVLAIMLALVMALSLAACGGSSDSGSASDPEKIVKEEAEVNLRGQIAYKYSTQGRPSFDSYVTKIDDTLYKVTGKVTVKDDYGDSYTGKYTVEVEFNPDTNKAVAKDIDLETPKKN